MLLNRRGFFAAGMAGGLGLAGCGRSQTASPLAAAIAAAEAARPHTGRTVTATLTAQTAEVDIGGPVVRTMAYGNAIPGPLIRANVGDEVEVAVSNRLDRPTSVHWHGIAIRNDMDGVEPATPNIPAGQDFTYRFSVPNAGTYWAHPHVGLESDEGLYIPFIVDDPSDTGRYDAEWIVVLDDWTEGVGKNPQQLYDALIDPNKPPRQEPAPTTTQPTPSTPTPTRSPTSPTRTGRTPTPTSSPPTSASGTTSSGPTSSPASGMPGMPGGAVGKSNLLGGDAGDIAYPYYLINGRIPSAATSFTAKPRDRIRIRIINVASDTAFRVALAGHTLTVTHTDGYPVIPTRVDALLVGMAERYDVIVTAADGVFPLVASAEGKNALARALLTTGKGSPPDPQFLPPELNRRVGVVEMFTAVTSVNLGRAEPGLNLPVVLGGTMTKYDWTINGEPYSRTKPLHVRDGQRPTLTFDNTTMMWHPIHLHGHTFQVLKADGSLGARKDTVIVLPKQKLSAVLIADNPGTWVMHCHNTYHQEAGMMTRLDYVL